MSPRLRAVPIRRDERLLAPDCNVGEGGTTRGGGGGGVDLHLTATGLPLIANADL